MNLKGKMVARGHVLSMIITTVLIFSSIISVSCVKKCKDINCSGPISMARAIKDYEPNEDNHIHFKEGDIILVFSKNLGSDNSIWEGSVKGFRRGFFLSNYIKETSNFVHDDKLITVGTNVQRESGNQRTNPGELVIENVQVTVVEEGKPEREYKPTINGETDDKNEKQEDVEEDDVDGANDETKTEKLSHTAATTQKEGKSTEESDDDTSEGIRKSDFADDTEKRVQRSEEENFPKKGEGEVNVENFPEEIGNAFNNISKSHYEDEAERTGKPLEEEHDSGKNVENSHKEINSDTSEDIMKSNLEEGNEEGGQQSEVESFTVKSKVDTSKNPSESQFEHQVERAGEQSEEEKPLSESDTSEDATESRVSENSVGQGSDVNLPKNDLDVEENVDKPEDAKSKTNTDAHGFTKAAEEVVNSEKQVEGNLEQETPDVNDTANEKPKKPGFFSSMKNLVTDFTDNIFKDPEEDNKGKAEEESKEQTEDSESDDPQSQPVKTTETSETKEMEVEEVTGDSVIQPTQKELPAESLEILGNREEIDSKPRAGNSLAEKLRQLEAEQFHSVKGEPSEALKILNAPAAEGEFMEKMKEEAKKTVEGIPSLMKEQKINDETNEKTGVELTKDGPKVEGPLSPRAGEPAFFQNIGETDQKNSTVVKEGARNDSEIKKSSNENVRKFSDKELCDSVPKDQREICDENANQRQCLSENCCFDENAETGKQCFFKPSMPESGYFEKDPPEVLEEEMPVENEDAAPRTTSQHQLNQESIHTSQQQSQDDGLAKLRDHEEVTKPPQNFQRLSAEVANQKKRFQENGLNSLARSATGSKGGPLSDEGSDEVKIRDSLGQLERKDGDLKLGTSVGNGAIVDDSALADKDILNKDIKYRNSLDNTRSIYESLNKGYPVEKPANNGQKVEQPDEGKPSVEGNSPDGEENGGKSVVGSTDSVQLGNMSGRKDQNNQDEGAKESGKEIVKNKDDDFQDKSQPEEVQSPDNITSIEGNISRKNIDDTRGQLNQEAEGETTTKNQQERVDVKEAVQNVARNETIVNGEESVKHEQKDFDDKESLEKKNMESLKSEIVQKPTLPEDSADNVPADKEIVPRAVPADGRTLDDGSLGITSSQTNTENVVKESADSDKPEVDEQKPVALEQKLDFNQTDSTNSSDVVPSPVTTDTTPPLEKKILDFAPKWMANKLMKDKVLAQKYLNKDSTSGKGDEHLKTDSEKKEKSESSDVGEDHEPVSHDFGTCSEKGQCEKTSLFSTKKLESGFEKHDGSARSTGKSEGVKEVKEDSMKEQKDKNGKNRTLGMLAVAVRTFNVYHTAAGEYGLVLLRPVTNIIKIFGEQMGLAEVVGQMEHVMNHGPQGVVSLTMIMIGLVVYFLLSLLCRKKVPPCYGPNLKDIFRTYEGRIKILEHDCAGYKEQIKRINAKASEDVGRNSALEKELLDEKHERGLSEEQISILKEIVKNLNEKVDLLQEESSKLKQSIEEKNIHSKGLEEQLASKAEESDAKTDKIKQLESSLDVKEEEKDDLKAEISNYKEKLSKAEDDTHRHKNMLQDWNDRYLELQQKYDDISVAKQSFEEQLHFKDNEMQVLRESFVLVNNDVDVNGEQELSDRELKEERSKKIEKLMDVSQIRADYKLCKEEKEKLEDDMKQEIDRREKLEGEVEQLETDLAKSKASEEEIRFKYREADIKLNALQDYFKNMESDLHRKLTAEEAARLESESQLERKLREASTAAQDVQLYRKQVDELRKEIDETQQAFRSQLADTEGRAHENWLKFRSAERELEEMKRERDALRRRLYDLETNAKPSVSPEAPVSLGSIPHGKFESSAARSDSPSLSIRSSKGKNSRNKSEDPLSSKMGPRPSSASPQDERKPDRVRRKTRGRNSPPSWEPDVGPLTRRRGRDKDTTPPPPWDPAMEPPPRRRDKDMDTPPPPPPPWELGIGPVPRRKGQRESPVGPPSTFELETQRTRRDRYSPSPPPPPPMDADISQSRRRRRDRTSSSSSPPPPPPNLLPPRGIPPHVFRPQRTEFGSHNSRGISDNGVPGTGVNPPPPPLFAANAPYPRLPPARQLLPNGPSNQFVPIRPAPPR